MTTHCECRERHLLRKIVLTGGPGAVKTAVLEMIRHSLCDHVAIVPEAAGVIFGGGFPRSEEIDARRAAQRAIYHLQLELEATVTAQGTGIMLCDRGAADGSAYWPGPDNYWSAVGTTREQVLNRYDAVIHLRVPSADGGYGHQNPLRTESAAEARAIDDRIHAAWSGHPRRFVIDSAADFIDKAHRTLEILSRELPGSCHSHASDATNRIEEARRAEPT